MTARPPLPQVSADDVVERLKRACEARGLSRRLVRACGLRQWDAPCPAHDDRHPSLRFYAIDGKLYFHCYAGCHFNAVRAALGLPAGSARGVRAIPARTAAEPRPAPRYNFDQLARLFAVDRAGAAPLAAELGVSADALLSLGLGRANRYPMYVRSRDAERPVTAWTFPMRYPTAAVSGLRMRGLDGAKFSFTDSTPGLFLPGRWHGAGPVAIVEGPTDLAAVLDWGFDGIGKPSCNDGDDLVEAVLVAIGAEFGAKPDVVILANLDEPKPRPDGTVFHPGQDGAAALADRIVWRCKSIRVITPPAGIKDARQWLRAGGTRADVDEVVQTKRPWRRREQKRRSA